MENTVETNFATQQPDDAGNGAAVTLAEVLGTQQDASADSAVAGADVQGNAPLKEPGYVQRRIADAIAKATPGIQESVRAEYQGKLDTLTQKLDALTKRELEREADALVASGEIKSRETALELLRLRNGVPAETKPIQQRDEAGRFTTTQVTTQEPDSEDAVKAQAKALIEQAKAIQKATGVDVLDLYRNNAQVQEKINNGEWDFSDAYREMQGAQKRAPAAVRGSNGVTLGNTNIAKMSEKDFKAMNEYLAKGGSIDLR